MKLRKISYILLVTFVNAFGMSGEFDGRITPPKRLKRSDVDVSQYMDKFVSFKESFRKAVGDAKLDEANEALNSIEHLSQTSGLILANPKIMRIFNFLSLDEVRRFKNIYRIYCDKCKEELEKTRILIPDLVKIIQDYIHE